MDAIIDYDAVRYNILGIDAEDVRTYQFSELSRFAEVISEVAVSANAPAAVILAGDFNEDAYVPMDLPT